MDRRQLDLDELKELTSGAESGGFSLAEILADFRGGEAAPAAAAEPSPRGDRAAEPRGAARRERAAEPRHTGAFPAQRPRRSAPERAADADRTRLFRAAEAPKSARRDAPPETAAPERAPAPAPQAGGGFSVADILSDFYADREAESLRAEVQKEQEAVPVKHRRQNKLNGPEPGVRDPGPRTETPRAEPPVGSAPAAREAAAPSWSFERRQPRPSEAEIRAFVADYARADDAAAAGRETPPAYAAPDFDERFHLGDDRPKQRELRYDGKTVDQSGAEGYVPPAAPEYVSSYAPEADAAAAEENEEEPRGGLLGRVRELWDRERGAYLASEQARREAGRKKPELRGAEELVLPAEREAEAERERAAREAEAERARAERERAAREAERRAAAAEETQVFPAAETPAGAGDEPTAAVRGRREAKSAPSGSARRAARTADRSARAGRRVIERVSDDADAEEEDDLAPAWTRRLGEQRPYASVFPDTSANPALYAPQSEAEYELPEEPDREDEGAALRDEDFFPPTFKEYILSRLTVFLYRVRGGMAGALTAEEDDEELGPEVTSAQASKYYGSFLRSLRLRLLVSGALLLMMAWISLGLPVTGKFNDTAVASLFCLAVQLTIMLLSLDVVVKGVSNAIRGRFGADFTAVLACVVTSLDALLSALAGFGQVHLPLCLLSSLSLTGVLLSSFLSARGLRKALRVPAIARRSYAVTGETNTKNGEVTLLKSVRPLKGFVRRSEEEAPDETLFRKLNLPLLALVLLLTIVTVIVKRNVRDIFYILSVLLCPAVPFTALLAFAIPFAQGSRRLFPSGAAVAGWSGVCDIGQSKNIIVTDRDLFPEGTVELDTVRIFADVQPERIISYAGSLLCAGGSGVSGCFADLMQRKNCPMRQIENFEYLPGGGMKGIIDSSVILCGSTDLMQLMNVRIPYRLVNRQSVLLAVDGVLYGIFNMKYTPDNRVRGALLHLMRSGRHPVFAIRDFNVTPSMLHDTFEVATDGYDFPPYVERFPLSEGTPGPDSKVAAVVCREGLGPLSDTADYGRRMYVYTRVNLYAAALSAVLGVAVSFVRLLSAGGVGVGFLLLFMLLWSVPALLTGAALRIE